jgi:broad specificity phosphatase PhoE
MARLLLIRHGDSDHTLRGPEGLTATGRAQVDQLADRRSTLFIAASAN